MPIPPPASTTKPVNSPVSPSLQGGDDADVVRVDVDAVVARPGDADLELARQVGLAVQRLDRSVGRRCLGRDRPLAVDPQLPVRRGARPEPSNQFGDDRCEHGSPVGVRQRAGHHVADDVTAGGERREQRVVDATHDVVQLTLRNEVVLHALPGGQAHRAVGELGEAVERQPLIEGDHPAWHRRAHHARVVERELLLRAGPAHVAVVLLVDAVELEQHRALGPELVGLKPSSSPIVAAQVPALGLDRLDGHGATASARRRAPERPTRATRTRSWPFPPTCRARGSSPDAGRVHGQQPIDG